MNVHHIALKVEDLQRCERFYAGFLGLAKIADQKDEKGSSRAAWFDMNGAILMLERVESEAKRADNTPGWHLMALRIRANEREGWKERLKEAGIKITGESRHSIYFTDPENNPLAFSHYPEGGPYESRMG